MGEQQAAQATARLIGALLCEDALVAKDERVAIWSEYNIIAPAAPLPQRRTLKVFSKWFVMSPGRVRLSARLFSPTGEMVDELAVDLVVAEGGVVHTQIFPFGLVEFHETGQYNVVVMRGEVTLLEMPLFVLAPPTIEPAPE